SRIFAGRELLGEVLRRLGDEERQMFDRRSDGRAWDEIAAELGGTPDGRRVQLARALDRVDRELGLTEAGQEGPTAAKPAGRKRPGEFPWRVTGAVAF